MIFHITMNHRMIEPFPGVLRSFPGLPGPEKMSVLSGEVRHIARLGVSYGGQIIPTSGTLGTFHHISSHFITFHSHTA